MKILYIFPHPDDESFGPATGISFQKRQGHEVYLLTLTQGGATKMRHEFGYSIEEMGKIRAQEVYEVGKVLDLDGVEILDLPDSGLKEMDPRDIEKVVMDHILKIQPNIVVTYPVHGISGFHDHLVIHAVAKSVFLQLREDGHDWLKRLAFFTHTMETVASYEGVHNLNGSTDTEIDCRLELEDEDRLQMKKALSCYVTYQKMISQSIDKMPPPEFANYEFYQEEFDPPVGDITAGL